MHDDRAAGAASLLQDVPESWQPFFLLEGPVHFTHTLGHYPKPKPEPNVVVLCDYPPLDGCDPPEWVRHWFHERGAKLDLVPIGEPLAPHNMTPSQREHLESVVAYRQGAGPSLVLVAPTMHHFAALLNWLLYRQHRT